MSILQKLTEGVQSRDMQAEGQALLNKWEATGLLEGLNEGSAKQGMACLLENQAKELLREASSIGAGDVEGFAAVAFPIVRRVFGGLIANDLVSVQPMSLPSGLIFFLDFVHSGDTRGTYPVGAGQSVYGGNVVAAQLTGGVDLDGTGTAGDAGGFYDFNTGRSHATGSAFIDIASVTDSAIAGSDQLSAFQANTTAGKAKAKLLRHDPDLLASTATTDRVLVLDLDIEGVRGLKAAGMNLDALSTLAIDHASTSNVDDGGGTTGDDDLPAASRIVRRLTSIVGQGASAVVRVVITCPGESIDLAVGGTMATNDSISFNFAVKDELGNSTANDTIGAVVGSSSAQGWEQEKESNMAEIDIKVDSIAVTAQTKKLKAKWTPELGQDLNAYHNLDAEVELTGILSEQIALEIDRELLGDLVAGATAGTRYWSRAPGLFVDATGAEIGATSAAPDFTGTVSEWYETLIETINDVSAQIHRKTLRGGANFVVCSPEVANILEFTSGFRASVTADQDRGTIGAVKSGSLSKKFDVYVDPYFVRNVVLVGRKGSSFLESGFVYAPYVPLQVTPTIFGTEDFVPRKGVMTRYAKKMVRPDMYGLVVVRGLLGESGL
jgi:hypothetical protein